MPPTKFWAEMTWTDFQDEDMAQVIAVLPVAGKDNAAKIGHLDLERFRQVLSASISTQFPIVRYGSSQSGFPELGKRPKIRARRSHDDAIGFPPKIGF